MANEARFPNGLAIERFSVVAFYFLNFQFENLFAPLRKHGELKWPTKGNMTIQLKRCSSLNHVPIIFRAKKPARTLMAILLKRLDDCPFRRFGW